jgi:hypothetical protein
MLNPSRAVTGTGCRQSAAARAAASHAESVEAFGPAFVKVQESVQSASVRA